MRYRRNNGTMAENYPHAFGKKDFESLARTLHQAKAVVPLIELARGNHDLQVVGIQHDVDHNIEHALKFATWEAREGFRSSYFVLHTAWYYDNKATLYRCMDKMIELGHEVGVHHNVAGDVDKLRAVLNELRGRGYEIVGTSAHGAVKGFWDCTVYDKIKPQELGIEYEAVLMGKTLNWTTDNHGKWWREPSCAMMGEHGKQLDILMHPCHWDVDKVL